MVELVGRGLIDAGALDSCYRCSIVSETVQLRRAVLVVALANLLYFGVEFAVARRIGSVSLLADSVDFLEDTSVNLLIAVGLGWSVKARG